MGGTAAGPGTVASGGVAALADGRRIGFRVYGDASGFPVLALHGTPGSSIKFASTHSAAQQRGLRIIAVDRWGYGATDAPSVPAFSGFAEDMASLADALGLDRFAVMGVSGGGPFAAAVAAGLGDRVAALALVAPVGEVHSGAAAAMSAFHTFCFRGLPRLPGAVRGVFWTFRALLSFSPGLAIGLMTSRVGAADRAIMAAAAEREALARCFREGLASSLDGPVIDMRLFASGSCVAGRAISAPAHLWIGEQDRNVPLGAAHALADRLPGCTTTRLPGQGHYWIARNAAQVVDWIANSLGREEPTQDGNA